MGAGHEHLLFDPVFTFSEINRILAPGGTLFLAAPNIASNSSLLRLINCQQPAQQSQYIVGNFKDPANISFLLSHRHCHEYTQNELKLLAGLTGFRIDRMFGVMPRPQSMKHWKFRLYELLTWLIFPRSGRIREDTIVAVMRKDRNVSLDKISDRYPKLLYSVL
ncbi:MAG: hypothetical protein AB7T27_10860 [Kiritimatiellia bacterium]